MVTFRIDGADRVDDLGAGQVVGFGHDGVARGTSTLGAALANKLGAGGTMDGAIYASATKEGVVCGIDNGVNVELGDVSGVNGNALVELRRRDGEAIRAVVDDNGEGLPELFFCDPRALGEYAFFVKVMDAGDLMSGNTG